MFPVTSQSEREIEFLPSITSASELVAVSSAFLTVIAAVEYIAGELMPLLVYVPPSTFTVPPPRSERIAAEELPFVSTVRLLAFVVPPPVVCIPPELSSVVVIAESDMLTVVFSP